MISFLKRRKKFENLNEFLLLSLLIFTPFLQNNSGHDCHKETEGNNCGPGCTGRPHCGLYGRRCGNVDDMCYCSCGDNSYLECKTTKLGFKRNNGIKLANGSYALNGTKGDGNYYRC